MGWSGTRSVLIHLDRKGVPTRPVMESDADSNPVYVYCTGNALIDLKSMHRVHTVSMTCLSDYVQHYHSYVQLTRMVQRFLTPGDAEMADDAELRDVTKTPGAK